MPPPQGLVSYAGVLQPVSASYTLSHGITPGVAGLEIAPQSLTRLSPLGILEFTFDKVRLRFPDCKLDRRSVRKNAAGEIVAMSVQDRRWKWAYGEVSGHYNLRIGENTVDARTAKTPRQLADLCLLAMGEIGYDTKDLPNDARPLIHWERANPAQMLARLCEDLSCRVVLQLNNRVAIRKTGTGRPLLAGGEMMESLDDGGEIVRPSAFVVVCGRTRYQMDLLLEPVGKDMNGAVKPIDQLSYKPSTGWAAENPRTFAGVAHPAGAEKARALAFETVYRWYRVKDSGHRLPGQVWNSPDYTREQLLPLEDVLVETVIVDNKPVPKRALIYGIRWDGGTGYANEGKCSTFKGDFSIDRERGIVMFRDVVTKTTAVAGGFQFVGTDVYLRCTSGERAPIADGGKEDRFEYRRNLAPFPNTPNPNTKPRFLQREEIVLTVRPQSYDSNCVPSSRAETNAKSVNRECLYYTDAAIFDYEERHAQSRQYAGLLAVDPDGAIQQVTWSVGSSGATTRASRNDESSPVVPSYRERRFWEKLGGDVSGGEGLTDEGPPPPA